MVVEDLTAEEQQIAAGTSYAYWATQQLLRTTTSTHRLLPCDETISSAIRMATREARRHYVGENGNYERALLRLKRSLQWRKERRVDLLRLCFAVEEEDDDDDVADNGDPSHVRKNEDEPLALWQSTVVALSKDDAKICCHYEKLIEREMQIQPMAVRGHDRENRPIIVKWSRRQKWNSNDANAGEEAYVLANLYVTERAIACAECSSQGMGERLTTIFDFGNYSSANAPPTKLIVDTTVMLQANYPERVGRVLILGAPLWMQAVFTLLTPLLAKKTRQHISVLRSVEASTAPSLMSSIWPIAAAAAAINERDDTVRAVVEPRQAMPFMLKDAKLVTELNMDRQLKSVPFHELYYFMNPRENGNDS